MLFAAAQAEVGPKRSGEVVACMHRSTPPCRKTVGGRCQEAADITQ